MSERVTTRWIDVGATSVWSPMLDGLERTLKSCRGIVRKSSRRRADDCENAAHGISLAILAGVTTITNSMADSSRKSVLPTQQESFGQVALRGSAWNLAQSVLNKFLTSAAIFVIAYFLSPSEYGVGVQALATFSVATFLQPLTVGDVLIAHPRRFAMLAKSASGLAMIIGCCMAVMTLVSIPIALHFYDEFPPLWLGGLLAVLSIRPILEARLMLPLSALRLGLAYRRMAMIDGLVQMGATLLSVATAMLGGRAASLVVPQVVAVAARGVCYHREVDRSSLDRFDTRVAGFLFRSFAKAASAQYIHNVIVMLEVLVLGIVSGSFETGLFGFVYTIASQANSIIAFQLGVVLQPIFGRLQDDPERQVAGFLKSQRVLSAVCVPISFAQAILAEPLFRLLLDEKWQLAIPVFQVISVMQAFTFAAGPSMSCLRAQRRFGTFLVWQIVQFVVSCPIYWFGAKQSGALGIAIASASVWAISTPLVVWLCTRSSPKAHGFESLAIFVRPWLVCVPIFCGAYPLVRLLCDHGDAGSIASLVFVGPATALVAIWVMRWTHTDIRTTLDGVLASTAAKLRRRG